MRKVAYWGRWTRWLELRGDRGEGDGATGEGHVILRVIRGRGDHDSIGLVRAELVDRLGPGPAAAGPDRYHLGAREAREGLDALLLSCWASAEAAAAADASDTSPLRIASHHLESVEVAHFELDVVVVRDAAARPAFLRLGTGRFSRPGADVEMQELLRERLHTIGSEMTEAYVGRRMLGRAIDVTFVSAWSAAPAGLALEDAFWPDISLRYDRFDVEVYRAPA